MKAKRNRFALALGPMALAGGLLGSGGAWAAGTETGMLTVSATVEGACSIGDQTLNFGNITSINVGAAGILEANAEHDATTIVAVICTSGTEGTVTLNDGVNKGATYRRMKNVTTADLIEYHLYNNSYTTEIAADNGATTAYTITGDGTNKSFTVYGRILAAALSNQVTGAYTDSVTMTINYTP